MHARIAPNVSENLATPPAEEKTATKTVVEKLLRAESPQLIGPVREIESFSGLMNDRIGTLVNTVIRWWGGGFGDVPGEDSKRRDEMQTFTAVALENVPAAYLVRVFTHLARGGLLQSATGVIAGETRSTPRPGPLEKAIQKEDHESVERFNTYLKVARSVENPLEHFRPLAFLEEWKVELGSKWLDLIIDDAAQYLRHHIKLLDRWESEESSRLKELDHFEKSKRGSQYLAARERFCPEGLPRSREDRFNILNQPELAAWKKKNAQLAPAGSLKILIDKNKELQEFIRADLEYARLTKPNTPPTWTPISESNRRWPFIPAKLFASPLESGGKEWHAEIQLPTREYPKQDGARVTVRFAATDRLRAYRASDQGSGWTFLVPDEITGVVTQRAVKGVRFEKGAGQWMARLSYEKQREPSSLHEAELLQAAAKRLPPPCAPGDMICVFTLEPALKGGKANRHRAGWFEVHGITEDGSKILYRQSILSTHRSEEKPRAIRRGKNAFSAEGRTEAGHRSRPSAHGEVDSVTLPRILEESATLRREVRLLRILKDPERRVEAIEWLSQRISAVSRDASKRDTVTRLQRLLHTLENGDRPTQNQLKPFKERISVLRSSIQGKKELYRHTTAKEVLRAFHAVREGKICDAVSTFRSKYPSAGNTILVTEYHKGKGPGHYKTRGANRALAAIGPSTVYELLHEKGSFMSPAAPIATISPATIRKECPSCGHGHSSNPSGDSFGCSSCGTKKPVMEVAAFNLAKQFFMPPAARETRAVVDSEPE